MAESDLASLAWWQDYTIARGRWSRWRIGSLDLFVRAMRGEWVFAWRANGDPLDETLTVEVPTDAEPDAGALSFRRYTVAFESLVLQLLPRQPDRAFVVRPELPLFLPAGEEVTLYVSTPVWVSGSPAGAAHDDVFEVPSFRASDTWFGKNTLDGELCYATRTYARTDLEAVGVRPHRATTPLQIKNEGADTLPIEQLRIPIPALSIYQGMDGRLWTDMVSLVRGEGMTSAALTVSTARKEETSGHILIREPRSRIESGTIISAFSRFLS